MQYDVEYELDGKKAFAKYLYCKDPGQAFAWCQQQFPGCKVVSAVAYGTVNGVVTGQTHYDAPPVQRDPVKEPRKFRVPTRNERDGIMPFYDEALSERPRD